ncbi:Acylamino-acid-releasing enzyme [Merluccius polli]|uniref:Acylamino-acid-releasing enzyme n=1 Tax=Merluccius polli TaxID=89951 RepID=A0AA47MLE1_MERPO|nr:Acylamino-acid-releasing enzyme [Merluccius polli]
MTGLIFSEWSQNHLVGGSRLRYLQQWTLLVQHKEDRKTVRTVLPPGPCAPLQGELVCSLSPVRGLRAVVRETAGSHQVLEIWDSQGLRKSLDLTALNKHGRVYDDAQFGGLSWSGCETRLLYVAERIRSGSPESPGKPPSGKDRSVYREDWGEGFSSKSLPVLCVVELETGNVSVMQGVPPHVSPGQALWAPGSQAVFFVGWSHEPFRLGLKFCSNRRSALFLLGLDGRCECLSGEDVSVSVSSPRLSPDGTGLVYLQGRVFGPHNQCVSLHQYDLQSKKTSILLDVVNRPNAGECAGIYETLPSSCWSADSQRVVFSSACRNRKDLFVIDRRTKTLAFLSNNQSEVYGSWKLLAIQKDLMVVCCSSPHTPPTLRVGFLPPAGGAVEWHTLHHPAGTFDFHWTVLDVTPPTEEDNTQYSGLDFGAVLVRPRDRFHGDKIPLVVFIHGGPHSQFPAEWNTTTAGLVKLGFAVLMVNYRGSTGFGQDSILSLIGRIGDQDVKDVQRAVATALQRDAALDAQRLAVIGGSHGGFLSCHLVGQYPDVYRACAARNPVVNAATLLGTSDIVDWRYSSVGLLYSYDQIPTAEALAVMLERSPIIHAAQIQTPVLLMIGAKDRRVSPHQGLELYRALKSRDSPVRLLWFPEDGHSLGRVDTQADCFLNTALWLQQHL